MVSLAHGACADMLVFTRRIASCQHVSLAVDLPDLEKRFELMLLVQ